MIFFRNYILIIVLLFAGNYAKAQDSNYVYTDTAILNAGSVKVTDAGALFESKPEESNEGHMPDTIIRNKLFMEIDSVRAIKGRKPFAYAKNLDSLLIAYQRSIKKKEPSNYEMSWLERLLSSAFTQYFFWALAVLFVVVILYKLFFTEGFFQRPYAKASVSAVPEETDPLLLHSDYDPLIALAVSKNNYRAAVRYHYLQTLQKLILKGAIQFAPDKTNYQYVNELLGKPYKSTFADLTLHYEYVWYGEIDINHIIYLEVRNKFKQFNTGI